MHNVNLLKKAILKNKIHLSINDFNKKLVENSGFESDNLTYWATNAFINNDLLFEDIENGKFYDTTLRYGNLLSVINSDFFSNLNHYKTLDDILLKVRFYENICRKTSDTDIIDNTIFLYDKDNYLVLLPTNFNAYNYWYLNGDNTYENNVSFYNLKNPSVIIILPNGKKIDICADYKSDSYKETDDIVISHIFVAVGFLDKIKNINSVLTQQIALYLFNYDKNLIKQLPENLITKEMVELAIDNNIFLSPYRFSLDVYSLKYRDIYNEKLINGLLASGLELCYDDWDESNFSCILWNKEKESNHLKHIFAQFNE